jgi:hypothetical protein
MTEPEFLQMAFTVLLLFGFTLSIGEAANDRDAPVWRIFGFLFTAATLVAFGFAHGWFPK